MNGTSAPRRRRPTLRRAAAAALVVTAAGLVTVGVRAGDAPPGAAGVPPSSSVTASAGATTSAGATAAPPSRPVPPRRPGVGTRPRELTTGPVLPTSAPVRLDIPTLRVSTGLIGLGLQPDGTMEVPGDAATAGWYTAAPTPGSLGPAVVAAHVNLDGRPGVFTALATLRPGDTVEVARADGTVAVFAITTVQRHPKDRFPTEAVYGAIDHAGLRLITCGGDFDTARRSYRDNVVAFARLVRTERR